MVHRVQWNGSKLIITDVCIRILFHRTLTSLRDMKNIPSKIKHPLDVGENS